VEKKRKREGRAEEEIEEFSLIENGLFGPDWQTRHKILMNTAALDYTALKIHNEGELRALVRRVEERVDTSSRTIPLSDWLIYAYYFCMQRHDGVLSPAASTDFIERSTRLIALLLNGTRSPKIVQIMAKRSFFPLPKTKAEIKAAERAAAYKAETERLALAWGAGGTAKRLNK
jgi:hypothetical protein